MLSAMLYAMEAGAQLILCADERSALQEVLRQLPGTQCHIPVLWRLIRTEGGHVRAAEQRSSAGAAVLDPHRWTSMALLLLNGAAEHEFQEATQSIFARLVDAAERLRASSGLGQLLAAYSRLAHVTSILSEGVSLLSKALDKKTLIALLQAGRVAWADALQTCVAEPGGLPVSATAQPNSPRRNDTRRWRPCVLTAWGRSIACVEVAYSYTHVANVAMAVHAGSCSMGPRIRREPSFAQLACTQATPSQVRACG
jgi:hypothetical protein